MWKRVKQSGGLLFGAGLAAGLCVGIGMLVGALVTDQADSQVSPFTAEMLQASATDSSNTMAIATGHIAEGVEGLFVLDFITSNLQASVVNPRTLGLGGTYQHNVALDLGIQQGKQPRYLMTTGILDVRGAAGNIRPAGSIVYIADANSGHYAAYVLPWNNQALNYNATQSWPMKLLFKGSIRNVALE